jgi:hypothetical protein
MTSISKSGALRHKNITFRKPWHQNFVHSLWNHCSSTVAPSPRNQYNPMDTPIVDSMRISYSHASQLCNKRGILEVPTVKACKLWAQFITALAAAFACINYLGTHEPPFLTNLAGYPTHSFSSNTHSLFPEDKTINTENPDIIDKTLSSLLCQVNPGSFIGYAICQNRQSLYYITTVRSCYPYFDILVRDYTTSYSINAGTFLVIRLHHNNIWVKPPGLLGRHWREYIYHYFMELFFQQSHNIPLLDSDIGLWSLECDKHFRGLKMRIRCWIS